MPDMQKDLHPELEQSDKGEVSEMPEDQEEGKASASAKEAFMVWQDPESFRRHMERLAEIGTAGFLRGMFPTLFPTEPPRGIGAHRPSGSLASGRDDSERPTLIPQFGIDVWPVSRAKEKGRKLVDEGQADRSNKGTGQVGNVDGEDKEGV